ncbi:MAG: zinc ribbon domain-containing protein [Treponema sp.]|nr:zinc ribbon domain-containing protein [Treponema sp.]
MKKKPRFYCDHCGYEVGSEVKLCPYCGRHFASIRCPACTYSGPDKMFQNGCPMCGYSAPPPPKTKTKQMKKKRSDNYQRTQPLPFWSYAAVVFFLLLVIMALSWLITG